MKTIKNGKFVLTGSTKDIEKLEAEMITEFNEMLDECTEAAKKCLGINRTNFTENDSRSKPGNNRED